MKHKIKLLAVFAATALITTSCLKDEDNGKVVAYSDAAVTSFSLGTLKQVRDTVTKRGTDSTYTAKIKGNKFHFTIDQERGLIYNADSLPYGTKVGKVLVGMTTHHSGTIVWKSMTSDSLSRHSANDSVNLSQPRTLRVYSNDGSCYRNYTVTVNVHKQLPNAFEWSAPIENADFAQLTAARMVTLDRNIYLFGQKNGATVVYMASENTPSVWTASPAVFGADACMNSVVSGKYIYLANMGTVKRSSDGINWQTMGTDSHLRRLVAAGSTQLFGLSDSGTLLVSVDNGATWNTDRLDDATTLLPDDNFGYACQSLATNKGMERIVLIGTSTAQNKTAVWTKLVDTADKATSYPWTFVDTANAQAYALPVLTPISVFNYDSGIVSIGKSGSSVFVPLLSHDSGITWKRNKHYTYPIGLGASANLAATADSQNFIWLLSGNKLWRGRINRLGWKSPQKELGI